MEFLYTGILIIHLSLYLTLNGLHVQLHAISRCAGDTCESGVGVYPHCTDCNKFIYCIFGYAVERTCPENLVFDITYGICNFPKNAICWNNNLTGRTGIERPFNKLSITLLKRDKSLNIGNTNRLLTQDGQVKVLVKDLNGNTMKTDDPPEAVTVDSQEATMNTDDPPNEAEMNTDDPPEEAKLKTDNPSEEATMSTNEAELNTDDPPEEARLNTDGPPEEATMNTDDPPEEAAMNTDGPLKEATMNTEDPPVEATMNTDDPPEEAAMNTDDPPEEAAMNTDDPPEEAAMNTDDPPEEATMNTDDPPEEWNRQYSINPDFPQNRDPAASNTASKTYNQNDKQPLETSNEVLSKVVVPCVKDCNGMSQGTYQSCDGCTKYVSCMWGMKLDNTCFSGLYWDDISKKCVTHSTTC